MSRFDYVIVGGGSAGCVLANRLSADPGNRVLLVEAGGRDRNPMIHAPGGILPIMLSGAYQWHYLSAPQRNLDSRAFPMPRGKVLGGGSSINGMVYCRGAASDYDDWAQAGNGGWSYGDVLPYFRRAETYEPGADAYHGDSGPLHVSRPMVKHPLARAFVAAGQEAGYPYNDDTNGAHRLGFGPMDATVSRGRRASTAVAYLRPALHRPNLTVVTHAHVTRILFDGQRAVGIAYRRKGAEHLAHADREVILSAGALNSPHLLMLSGIGPADHLRDHGIEPLVDLPGVGQGLQDHAAVAVKRRSLQPISMFQYLTPVKGTLALGQYILLRRGPLADPGLEAVALVKSDESLEEPDIKILFVMALYGGNGRQLTPEHGFLAHISILRPQSVGSLSLASADPMALPVIDQNYLSTPHDRHVMRRGVQIAREVFRQPAFDPFRGDELAPGPDVRTDSQLDAFVRSNGEPYYHTACTARMGGDAMSVVDPQLRVHGFEGLRVVDASIMPRIVSGNTNVPVIMIAEKASDMILDRPPLPRAGSGAADGMEMAGA